MQYENFSLAPFYLNKGVNKLLKYGMDVFELYADEVNMSFCDRNRVIAKCRAAYGRTDLKEDPRFNTLQNRKQNEEELDKIIGEWTINLTAEEVMTTMQSAGVPAGVVENAADISEDPQLKHRDHFWPIEHPDMGTFNHLGQSMILSKTPAQAYMPSPRLGEHTEYVCTKIFGMSDEEFVQLLTEGVFE